MGKKKSAPKNDYCRKGAEFLGLLDNKYMKKKDEEGFKNHREKCKKCRMAHNERHPSPFVLSA